MGVADPCATGAPSLAPTAAPASTTSSASTIANVLSPPPADVTVARVTRTSACASTRSATVSYICDATITALENVAPSLSTQPMQRSSCVRLRPTHSATPQASARGPWLLPRFWRFVGLYALGASSSESIQSRMRLSWRLRKPPIVAPSARRGRVLKPRASAS